MGATGLLISSMIEDTTRRCLTGFRTAYGREPDGSQVSVSMIEQPAGLRRRLAIDVEFTATA